MTFSKSRTSLSWDSRCRSPRSAYPKSSSKCILRSPSSIRRGATYTWLPWVQEEPRSSEAAPPEPGPASARFEWRITERLRNLLKQGLPSAVQTELRRLAIARDIARNRYPVMDRVPEENVRRFRQDLLR